MTKRRDYWTMAGVGVLCACAFLLGLLPNWFATVTRDNPKNIDTPYVTIYHENGSSDRVYDCQKSNDGNLVCNDYRNLDGLIPVPSPSPGDG